MNCLLFLIAWLDCLSLKKKGLLWNNDRFPLWQHAPCKHVVCMDIALYKWAFCLFNTKMYVCFIQLYERQSIFQDLYFVGYEVYLSSQLPSCK